MLPQAVVTLTQIIINSDQTLVSEQDGALGQRSRLHWWECRQRASFDWTRQLFVRWRHAALAPFSWGLEGGGLRFFTQTSSWLDSSPRAMLSVVTSLHCHHRFFFFFQNVESFVPQGHSNKAGFTGWVIMGNKQTFVWKIRAKSPDLDVTLAIVMVNIQCRTNTAVVSLHFLIYSPHSLSQLMSLLLEL